MGNAKRNTPKNNAQHGVSSPATEPSPPSSRKQVHADDDETRIIERPDGFYWQENVTGKMYGPFSTLLKAMEDMQYQEDSDYEEGESLQEAEAEIGIADWIDPDTGELAEGSSPHLRDE